MRAIVMVVLLLSACGDKKPAPATDKPGAGSTDTHGSGSATGSARDNKATGATHERCVRGVTHVTEQMAAESKRHGAAPSPDEQRAIDAVAQASIAQCESEGFTQAQLDCLLAATNFAMLEQVATCAAIQAKRPTWLTGF